MCCGRLSAIMAGCLYRSRASGQLTIVLVTFMSYASFHVTRKSFSFAKVNMAYPLCNSVNEYISIDGKTCCSNVASTVNMLRNDSTICPVGHMICTLTNTTDFAYLPLCDAFFGNLHETTSSLAILDTLFLFCYAVGLFIAGFIEDRLNLRWALAAGSILSAMSVLTFGWFAYSGVKIFWPYAVAWSVNGLIQASGWPANVAIMGKWFGRWKCPCGGEVERGAVLGAWSGNASFGNILSYFIFTFCMNITTLDGHMVGQDGNWILGMVGSAVVLFSVGICVFFFVRLPTQVGYVDSLGVDHNKCEASQDELQENDEENGTVSFCNSIFIPGVIPYSLSYMCLKLANYAMFFWLPFYLSYSVVARSSATSADFISNTFDYGQILGGFIAGFTSDRLGIRAPVVVIMLLMSAGAFVPFLFQPNLLTVRVLVPVLGVLLGGPANLISATVSADLGGSVKNGAAMATVTGIVDGTGSLGAAVGQYLVVVLAGCHGSHCQWAPVFIMLLFCTVMAAVFLWRILIRECRSMSCTNIISVGDAGAENITNSRLQSRYSIMED